MPTAIAIVPTAKEAWRRAIDAIQAMRPLALTIFGIVVVLEILRMPLDVATRAGGFSAHVGAVLFQVATAFLMTPYLIAVHRFVLLGEVTTGYRLAPGEVRFRKFFVLSMAMNVIGMLPTLAMLSGSGFAFLAGLALLVVVFVVFVRITVLFPAIAVDAPGAEWRNAMDDSRGRMWPIFAVIVCAVLPTILLFIVGGFLFPFDSPGFWNAIGKVYEAAAGTIGFAALAAAASLLYTAFADRIGRPPNLVAPAVGAAP